MRRFLALLTAACLLLVPAPAAADTALAAPTGLQVTHVGDTSADLYWSHDLFARQDVVERNVGGTWTEYATGAFNSQALTGLQPGTTYTLRVYSLPSEASGYLASPPSATITFTTLSAPDSSPPSTPSTPLFSSISTDGVSVVWGESTDNVQVGGYFLQQLVGGAWTTVRITDAFGRFQRVTGLSPNTAYTFAVLAYDTNGNTSARSPAATVTTLPTTTAPSCRTRLTPFSPGFMIEVQIHNTTTAPVTGWSVGFTLASNAVVYNAFGAILTRSGNTGTLTPSLWNATINPGFQAAPGFIGTVTPFTPPADFTLNGVPCTPL
jgi:hypothetical protein